MKTVNLASFDNSWYRPGRAIKRLLWYFANSAFLLSGFPWPNRLKIFLLRRFGAHVGCGVLIKPRVNVKYPWFLEVGLHTWIGEGVWIDNLGMVKIGCHVCLSQGAYLCTGNHNFKKETFDLMIGPITIEDGVWIGAKAVVGPGVTMGSHSTLTAGSVLAKSADPYTIYKGNPAIPAGTRTIE